MFYIITSLIFFGLAVAGHVLWCRGRQDRSLWKEAFAGSAAAMLALYFLSTWLLGKNMAAGTVTWWTLPLNWTAVVVYILLLPIYVVFYFTMISDSPSKIILKRIRSKGSSSYQDLLLVVTNDEVIFSRLNDLERTNFIHVEKDQYRLLPRGHVTALFLSLCQKICNRSLGG